MNSWKVIPTIVLATVLIFGAGVFTGGLLVNCVKTARPQKPAAAQAALANNSSAATTTNVSAATTPKNNSARLPEVLSKEFLLRLETELHLSREQHEAVEKIIADGQGSMKKMMNAARLEIREVLTAEQQKQFDNLVKKQPKKSSASPTTNAIPPTVTVTNAP